MKRTAERPAQGAVGTHELSPDILFWMILGALFLAFRLPFLTDTFYNWDATQLGLALKDFDIIQHRPHPPGYILYVMLARVVHIFGFTPERTFQILSMIMVAVGLVGVYKLTRLFAGKSGAFIATVVAMFNSYIWGYSVIGESYSAEFAVCTWVGYFLVRTWRGDRNAALAGSLLLGLAGGVRTSVTMFLGPMWLAAVFGFHHPWKTRLLAAALGVVGTLVWFVPTVVMAGGFDLYMKLTNNLTNEVIMRSVSPIFGASEVMGKANLFLAFWWTGISTIVPLTLAAVLWMARRLMMRRTAGRGVAPNSDPGSAQSSAPEDRPGLFSLVAVWTVPALAFYAALFASKPGYVLTYTAPFYAVLGVAAGRLLEWTPVRKVLVAGVIGLTGITANAALFFAPATDYDLSQGVSATQIEIFDLGLDSSLKAISEERNKKGDDLLIIVNSYLVSWRRVMYYIPDLPIYYLIDDYMIPALGKRVDACVGLNHSFSCLSGPGFWTTMELPEKVDVPFGAKTRWLLFFGAEVEWPDYEKAVASQPWRLSKVKALTPYLTIDLQGLDELQVGAFRLVREFSR